MIRAVLKGGPFAGWSAHYIPVETLVFRCRGMVGKYINGVWHDV